MATPSDLSRRGFIRLGAAASVAALAPALPARAASASDDGFHDLCNGRNLDGWRPVPRLPPPKNLLEDASIPTDQLAARTIARAIATGHRAIVEHLGKWDVVDGAIVGGRDPVNSNRGCYLESVATYGDFELELEARPDFPADTGIVIRSHELANIGYQILLDHRPDGGLAGVYGNSLGAWIAAPFYITGDEQPGHRMANLRRGKKPATNAAPVTPQYAAKFEDFQRVWRLNDWNRFRIRCVGELPTITTWVNGLKICELDVATVRAPGWNPERTRRLLGSRGHIAFEVHDAGQMGHNRWAEGAVCRWKNIRLKEL